MRPSAWATCALFLIVGWATASLGDSPPVRLVDPNNNSRSAFVAKTTDGGYGLSVTCDNCSSTSSGPASTVTSNQGLSRDGGTDWPVTSKLTDSTGANSLAVNVSGQAAVQNPPNLDAALSTRAADATLTGGTAKAIVRGGAKGATTAADVTSTAQGADHQSVDVQIYSGGAAKDPTAIRALTSADVVTATQGAAAASTAGWPATAGTVAAATAAWTSSTTVDTALQLAVTGYGVAAVSFNPSGTITAGQLNFEASDDSGTTWYAVNASRQDSATTETTFLLNGATKKLWQAGVGGLTTFRVRLNPIIAGSGTANIRIQASAAAPETQVTAAQAVAANLNATVTGTVTTTPPSNATTNVTQFGSTNISTGTGASGTGIPRVTVSNDSSILGTKTNNNAAPGATNFGELPAVANAAAQTWVEGNQVALSTDLAGTLRSDMTKVAGSATATAATGVQLVGIEGRAGTSFESTAGVLDTNLKNVGNSAVSTAATGVAKVGVVGNAGAAFDGATGAVPPANAILTGLRESTNQVAAVQCDKSFNTSVTTAATTSLVAVSSTAAIYLCSYVIEIIGVATTAGSAQLEFGTGSACATTQQVITPAYLGTLDGTNKAATVIAQGPGAGYLAKSGASGVLCLVATADANTIKVFGTYAQF